MQFGDGGGAHGSQPLVSSHHRAAGDKPRDLSTESNSQSVSRSKRITSFLAFWRGAVSPEGSDRTGSIRRGLHGY